MKYLKRLQKEDIKKKITEIVIMLQQKSGALPMINISIQRNEKE